VNSTRLLVGLFCGLIFAYGLFPVTASGDGEIVSSAAFESDGNPGTVNSTEVNTATSARYWVQCASMPTAELCHATIYDPLDDYIYAIGGGDGTNYFNWTYRYDPVNDSWASLAAMPTAINWIDASVTQWNRRIYVFGGYDGTFHNYNYIYDIVGDSWSTGATMPANRIAAGQCVYNDSLVYMLCGHTGSTGSNSVYIYNTYTDTWTTGTNAPTTSYMMAVATTGDTLWLVMTYNGSSCNSTMYYGIPDPANCESIAWSTGPALPIPNFNGGGTQMYRWSMGEQRAYIYEVGGFENASTITPHAWEYDVNNDYWNALPDYPMPIVRNDFLTSRRIANTMVADIFVAGGDSSSGWTVSAEVWKLSWGFGVEEEKSGKGARCFGLGKITPNPVSNYATIAYTTMQKGPVSLKIYNSSGRLVRTLIDRMEDAGRKTIFWDGKDDNLRAVATGVYFCRLTAESKTVSEKMVVVK